MTERKSDDTLPPPGGRAAERLKQFEEARGLRKPGQPAKKENGESGTPENGALDASIPGPDPGPKQ